MSEPRTAAARALLDTPPPFCRAEDCGHGELYCVEEAPLRAAIAAIEAELVPEGAAVVTIEALAQALSATCHHGDMGYRRGECDEPWRHQHHATAILAALREAQP